jgi:gamma-glutamylaminecyclotransferase
VSARRRTTRVFVYGSLLSGEPNHRLLARAPLVAETVTEPRFALHDLGAFPGMAHGGAHAIAGEVYDVDGDTLAALDRLEGVPRFYQRAAISLADGTTAETYLLTRAQVEGRPVIATGSWRAHRKETSR